MEEKNLALLQKAAENINKTEWYRNEDFLEKRLMGYRITPGGYKILKSVLSVVEELYNDRFHINIRISQIDGNDYIFQYDLIIHYPKLKIMNEKDEHIIVNNFFQIVPFSITSEQIIPAHQVRGSATNPTIQQYLRRYAHSHLPSMDYSNDMTNGFCLGNSSTEHKRLCQELRTSKYDKDIFYMFAMNLTTVAQTESLAGKPFIKMSSVNLNERLNNHHHVIYAAENYMEDYKRKYNNSEDLYPLTWKLNNNTLGIVDDHKLEKHCLIYGGHGNDEYYNSTMLVRKDNLGNYYEYSQNDEDFTIDHNWSYSFKDKEFHFGIAEGATLRENKFYIHPKIKENVRKYLESKANLHYIKKYIKAKTEGNKQEKTHTLENKQGSV